jgi:ABC-type nitrate/sulfonate/bicarbonate transport system permease component
MNSTQNYRIGIREIVLHTLGIAAFLAFWEYAAAQRWLNPLFFGHPSAIY